jgi:hypothetical protein
MKLAVAIWLLILAVIAAQAATLVLSESDVLPGGRFTLTVTIQAGPPILGASLYAKSTGVFAIVDRVSAFPDDTTPTAQLGTISDVRSKDFAGSVDDFDMPIERPFVATVLTLESPSAPGSYVIALDGASVLLKEDFTQEPVFANTVTVRVVPEPPALLLLGCLGCLRLRPLH